MASLKHFFAPRSVALVGATNDLTRFGGRVLKQMQGFSYGGTIYPVNPRQSEVQGLPCYPSLLEVPGPVDHVGVVVPVEAVLGVLEQCAAREVPFVTVFTSGFAETGQARGHELQERLVEFSRRTGTRVMGPNCNGLINFVDGFAMTSTASIDGPRRPAGRVGVVAHSGGLGQVNTMWRAQQAGLGISYEVSCGNDADLDALDFIRFMVEDPATDLVLAVVERFSSGAKLAEVAGLARQRQKPIVVLKLGRTVEGSRAAASHTGAVTGADAVYDAAFRQLGLPRVEDFPELYETAMLLSTRRWPQGDGVAALSISGGNIVLLTDLGAGLGLDYPEFTPATQARIAELLPGYGKVGNPCDLTATSNSEGSVYQEVLNALVADERISLLVPILTLAPRRHVEDVLAAAARTDKPVALLFTGACYDRSVTLPSLVEQGLPTYPSTLGCLKAVRAALDYGRFLRRPEPAVGRGVAGSGPTNGTAAGPLTERASKQLLAGYGFPVTREALAETADQAVQLAGEFGYPVVLKIESPDLPHKTEANAVRLGLTSDQAVRRAFDEILTAARQFNPSAHLSGVLVQEQVQPGLEIILGLTTDPTFGPVLMVGLGGVQVEVLRDVAYRLPPIDQAEAAAMLRELRAYPLLEGVRGAPRADLETLTALLVQLGDLALQGQIAELDINPLILHPQGAKIVDALIVPTRIADS